MNPVARRTLLAAAVAAGVSTLGGDRNMGVISDAAQSRGDIMRRLDELDRKVAALSTARRLEAASIGRGGLRIKGGTLRVQDDAGEDLFRVGNSPAELFVRPDALAPFARQVIGETLLTAVVFGIGERNSTSYGNLSFIDPGPSITTEIGVAGKAVVALSCAMTVDIGAGRQGFMSVEVSGATDRDPDDQNAYVVGVGGDPAVDVQPTGRATELAVFENLNPGQHTFTSRYRTITAAGAVQFVNPQMAVWAF